MVVCSVPQCPSRSDRNRNINPDGSRVTFHLFPKESERLTAWLQAINRPGWHPNRCSLICSKHFTKNDFKTSNKRKYLFSSAIPSIFSLHKKKLPKRRRRKLLCDSKRGLYFEPLDLDDQSEKSKLPLTTPVSQCPLTSCETASLTTHCKAQEIENEEDNNEYPKSLDNEIILETNEKSELSLTTSFSQCPSTPSKAASPIAHHEEQDIENKGVSNKYSKSRMDCEITSKTKEKKSFSQCPITSFEAASIVKYHKDRDIENEGDNNQCPKSCKDSEITVLWVCKLDCIDSEKSELPLFTSFSKCPLTPSEIASPMTSNEVQGIENEGDNDECPKNCTDSEIISETNVESERLTTTSLTQRPLTSCEAASLVTHYEEQDIDNKEDSKVCKNPCKDSRIVLRRYRKKIKTLNQRARRALKSLEIKQDKLEELREENLQLKRKFAQYNISELENAKTRKSEFLLEQLKYFKQDKPRFTEETMKFAISLESNSPKGYEIIRNEDFLSLPSKSTLKRYIGSTSSNSASCSSKRISSEIG